MIKVINVKVSYLKELRTLLKHSEKVEEKMKNVIVIGIDGLGGKYINQENAPFISNLFLEGTYTKEMQNVALTTSGPNWMSMFTGVDSKKHGVVDDNWKSRKNKSSKFPTIFQILDAKKQDFAVFYTGTLKPAMEQDIIRTRSYNAQWFLTDRGALKSAINKIRAKKQPEFMFLHFDYVDIFGHIFGYGSRPYNWMVKRADSKVEEFINVLKEEDIYQNTVLIVTSDHGGFGKSHGGDTPEERSTFFVIRGPDIAKNQRIQRKVRIFDIMPTIAYFLKLKNKKIDGKLITETFK